jgi:hypothetical protein
MVNRKTSKAVYQEVCTRSGGSWIDGRCVGGFCEDCNNRHIDWRGLQFSHTRHRGMGGTTNPEVHSARNVKRRCGHCHDLLDGRTVDK